MKEKVADKLESENSRTYKFYTSTKIYKQGIPGRPVVISINCPTSKISKYVDYHLQPLVKETPLYVKDTKDFLNKMKDTEKVPEETYLIIMNIISLYTNIPHSKGVTATKKHFISEQIKL